MGCQIYSEIRESYHNICIIYTAGKKAKAYAPSSPPSNSVKREKFFPLRDLSYLITNNILRVSLKRGTEELERVKRCNYPKSTRGKSGNPECEKELTLFVEQHDAFLNRYRQDSA